MIALINILQIMEFVTPKSPAYFGNMNCHTLMRYTCTMSYHGFVKMADLLQKCYVSNGPLFR